MAETIRGPCARVLGALLLVALATRAEASGARLRWVPSADPQVTGYRVYVRSAGHVYGAPIDAGRPGAQADGSIAYVVSGLTTGQTYYFAVTAYGVAPLQSAFSRELPLGTPNPCTVDRCTSSTACEIRAAADGSSCDDGLFCNGIAVCEGGACRNGPAPSCDDGVACTSDRCDEALERCVHVSQSGCCTSNDDCTDNDACTSGEGCYGGSCISTPEVCPAASCASAFCDPVAGCGLMPTPDGITCDACGVLRPRKIVVRASGEGGKLNLRASFDTDAIVDPATFGLLLEISNGSGEVLYSATVPRDSFLAKQDGTKFRFLASGDAPDSTNGITGALLRRRGGSWDLTVRAQSSDLINALEQSQLAATLSFGFLCMSDAELTCQIASSRVICR
jgi:hypothetical protein